MKLFIIFLHLITLTTASCGEVDIFSDPPKGVSLQEVTVYNGKVKVLNYKMTKPEEKDFKIYCESMMIPYQVKGSNLEMFLFAAYYSKAREFYCESEKNGQRKKFLKVIVKEFEYKETQIEAQPSKVFLSKKDQQRVAREQKILNSIYSNTSSNLLFSTPFILPLGSERTSIYGDRRIFNKAHPSTHLGNDFRASEGTPIAASNEGRVSYVGDLFYSGKTVIVDHGMRLFSMYGHLSKISVKVGMSVKAGDIIGLSGATGRVSGPHLHWGVKINGEWIDGVSLVEEYALIQK